jgi:hypothetical protein
MNEEEPTGKEIRKALLGHFDSVTKKLSNHNWIARRGFYYRHGNTTEKYIEIVKKAFPNAVIVDSGEVWKAFRGGASLANQSHWYVEFNFKK